MKKILIAFLIFLSGVFVGSEFSADEKEITSKSTETIIPAVNSDGKGLTGKLRTTVKSGNGLILVNINDLIAQSDTQLSGRTASKAASSQTNISLDKIDVIYSIEVDGDIIEGSSAGTSMAVSIVAGLLNKSLNSSISITGSIKEDGSIGPAGSIVEKAMASKSAGAEIMLVANGQSFESCTRRIKTCQNNYCKIVYINEQKNLSMISGIELIEVNNLDEALKYFLID